MPLDLNHPGLAGIPLMSMTAGRESRTFEEADQTSGTYFKCRSRL
jgi:hypothetical protein